MAKAHVRKNDQVIVVSGKDRGRRGRVLEVLPSAGRVRVEGVAIVKRHTRPNPQKNVKGGIAERESLIHLSNVMLIDPETDRPTRVGRKVLGDGRRVRVARRSGAQIDK